jgi:hypothetical protein
MSELLEVIRKLVASRELRISEHGFDELSDDGISVRDAVRGVRDAKEIEEYPASGRGPAVLVLARVYRVFSKNTYLIMA